MVNGPHVCNVPGLHLIENWPISMESFAPKLLGNKTRFFGGIHLYFEIFEPRQKFTTS